MAVLADVIGRGTLAARPGSGSTAELYFATDEGKLYRWTGSAWELVDVHDLIAAKGDILAGSAADTLVKVTVGANDTILTADSAEAAGVKWAAVAGAADILDLPTAETDVDLRLAPDGAGGVEWGTGGGGSSAELDYAEITAAVAPTATTVGTANTVVTGASVAYDGSTAALIEFFCSQARAQATAAAQLIFHLFEDGTDIGQLGVIASPAANNAWMAVRLSRRITPSAANHTYSIRVYVSSGTASIQAGAGGAATTVPAFIRITRA